MTNTTCFLIEDDVDDREIFEIALNETEGTFNLKIAINGLDALNQFKADNSFIPDFIFLDLNMPLVSGIKCLEEIKKISHLKNVPVIIFTTSSYDKDIEDSRKLGASHFLSKPSDIKKLSSILSSIFQKSRLPFILN